MSNKEDSRADPVMEGNSLICDYLDRVPINDGNPMQDVNKYLRTIQDYHTSWDWLMPVWWRFANFEPSAENEADYNWHCKKITEAITGHATPYNAFLRLVDAIRWHKEQNPTVSKQTPDPLTESKAP